MIRKTLHWYIFRELLRVFLLTTAALTTLLAFGGTFKPLTNEGLNLFRLLTIMGNLIPAMLAYSIPIAALFAAVVVYWRLSTDNEITACRAGGISFFTMCLPAVWLGLLVTMVNMSFAQYVVPIFIQRTEQGIRSDIGQIMVNNIARQEPYEFQNIVTYADDAVLKRETLADGRERTIVELQGMAAMQLNAERKPTALFIARVARLFLEPVDLRGGDLQAWMQMEDGAVFDPVNFRKIAGSAQYLPPSGEPFLLPLQANQKPKYMDLSDLLYFRAHPLEHRPVAANVNVIKQNWRLDQITAGFARQIKGVDKFKMTTPDGETLNFTVANSAMDAEDHLRLTGTPGQPVQVEVVRNGRAMYMLSAKQALLRLESLSQQDVYGTLVLSGQVMRTDLIRKIAPAPTDDPVLIRPLVIDKKLIDNAPNFDASMLDNQNLFGATMQPALQRIASESTRLLRYIDAELHSRTAFALSCLPLVMVGAALGIIMRGRNPLGVFVVGFVPAMMLILTTVAGRQMIEKANAGSLGGYIMIWASVGLMAALVYGFYSWLIRK
ncbi:MAG: LptF/LptG family permease [Phycisphaerae bacterium]